MAVCSARGKPIGEFVSKRLRATTHSPHRAPPRVAQLLIWIQTSLYGVPGHTIHRPRGNRARPMVRRHLSCGRRDEGESHHRITQGGRIGGSRHDKKLAEKALSRKIKVKLTPVVSPRKRTPSSLTRSGSAEEEDVFLSVLLNAFHDLGYVEGKNIRLEHRFPAEIPDRFRTLAQELVGLKPDAIIAVTNLDAVEVRRVIARGYRSPANQQLTSLSYRSCYQAAKLIPLFHYR
jgi:hypothetical protein